MGDRGSVEALATADTFAFLDSVLPGAGRTLLEVGCGRGALAGALAGRGYVVTAVEPDPSAAEAAAERGLDVECRDVLDHGGGPYDAAIFIRSLHHMDAWEDALDHVLGLLAPSGLLVVEDLARERADRRTASFFYDTLGALAAAGFPVDEEIAPAAEPLARWEAAFRVGELPGGAAMEVAVAGRANMVRRARAPYLWRFFGDRFGDAGWAPRVAAYLREVERRRVREGALRELGLRLVARPR